MPPTKLTTAWRLHRNAGGVVLVPTDAMDPGRIRVRARVRPIPTLAQLAAQLGADVGSDAQVSVGPALRTTTNEGEYAVLARMTAVGGGREVHRSVGIVLGDDHCAVIEGDTSQRDRADHYRATVEKLVSDYALGLGRDRRRRYFYAPPPGWSGIAEIHATVWLAPGFPARHGLLTIFDARPAEPSAPLRQDRMLFEDLPLDFARTGAETLPFQSKFSLTGAVDVVAGRYPGLPPVVIHDALLRDAHGHAYLLRLESDEANLAEHRRAFLDLLATVEPLPLGDPTAPGHWLD